MRMIAYKPRTGNAFVLVGVRQAPCFGLEYRPYHIPAKPVVELDYILKAEEKALTFQVTKQSQAITDFLKKNRFMSSTGIIIAVDEFPEFKDSQNTLFLRGSDSFYNSKLDTTPFGSNQIRDGKERMIRQALRELVETVQNQVNAQYPW